MLSFKQYLNECTQPLVEVASEKRFWYSSKKNKFVAGLKGFHDWQVIRNPTKFGLKKSDVEKFEKLMKAGDDTITGIRRLMFAAGWVRITMEFFSGGDIGWSLQSKNLTQAHAAAKKLDKTQPVLPNIIFIDYGNKSEDLRFNQITTFLKTGSITRQTEIGRTMAQFR